MRKVKILGAISEVLKYAGRVNGQTNEAGFEELDLRADKRMLILCALALTRPLTEAEKQPLPPIAES